MEQNLQDFTTRIIKEYTTVTLFLSIGWITTIFVLGLYINYLRDKIEKLTTHNKDCAVKEQAPTPKPSDDGFAQS